jgi:hypothetical protein
MNIFLKIKKKIITYITINKILKFIKESHINAYIIGKEIIYIYSLLYNIYKQKEGNYDIDGEFYYYLNGNIEYNKFYLCDLLSKDIIFSQFFVKLNKKIFKLQDQFTWYFLRGYFVNDFELIACNLNNTPSANNSYIVMYDYHIHYLTFIYEFMKNIYIYNIDINVELNNHFDIYTINEITNEMNYKLIINHAQSNYNNPILDLFELLYQNIEDYTELVDNNDINLFKKYKKYKNNAPLVDIIY